MFFVIAESGLDPSLHLTLVPEFLLPEKVSPRDILVDLEARPLRVEPKRFSSFTTKYGEEIRALEMNMNEDLRSLHCVLLNRVMALGGELLYPSYVNEGYTPHITGSLDLNSFTIDRVTLSKRDDGGFTSLTSRRLQ